MPEKDETPAEKFKRYNEQIEKEIKTPKDPDDREYQNKHPKGPF
jgi:hypothetical protein